MDLKEILSIAGKPGLFKTIAQTKNGVIIESLADGKRSQAFASDKISSLGEISIFTQNEDMPLREVLQLMIEKSTDTTVPDAKAADPILKKYFETVVPQYDTERVYTSHIRKVVAWYHQLVTAGFNDFKEPAEENNSPGNEKEKQE